MCGMIHLLEPQNVLNVFSNSMFANRFKKAKGIASLFIKIYLNFLWLCYCIDFLNRLIKSRKHFTKLTRSIAGHCGK